MTNDTAALNAAKEKLKSAGIEFIQVEVTELDGAQRGKLVTLDKGLGGDVGFSSVLFGLTTADDVWESPFTSFENGFLDYFARPQAETVRVLPWRDATASVICDFYDADGAMTPECPRTALHRAADKAAEMDFETRFAVEYEVFVFHADADMLAAGRGNEMRPLSRTWNAYSLLRLTELRELFVEFMRRMAAIGAPLDSTHSEIGHGAVEFAIGYAPAMDAADHAMRAKTYLKELCNERGLSATFMAKLDMAQPGAGGHVHQSLWRDGESVFWQDGAVSDVARHYAGGQLALMPELTALSMPNINSYRRMQWEHWVPENASWGEDNRSAALRLITLPKPSAVRFENRVPGADANAYLSIAWMLASGLHGIENEIEPPHICEGNAYEDARYPRLPHSLQDATQALKASSFAREAFGERFVDHYVLSREEELRLWDEWQRGQVSAWEYKRYFETI